MRKFLFAILLIGAAFAGGAVINGPGLERVKAAILARLRAAEAPSPKDAAEPKGPPKDVPSAPLPPLIPDGLAAARPAPDMPRPPAIAVAAPPPRSEAAPIDLVGPDPVAAEAPRTTDAAVSAASRTEAPPHDWSDLRRRMRALGVSRYEVEGDPGGRSRFRCLIPLAGRRAVGQQFEGEGDDDFQAAEAALRRVALWRATEMAPP